MKFIQKVFKRIKNCVLGSADNFGQVKLSVSLGLSSTVCVCVCVCTICLKICLSAGCLSAGSSCLCGWLSDCLYVVIECRLFTSVCVCVLCVRSRWSIYLCAPVLSTSPCSRLSPILLLSTNTHIHTHIHAPIHTHTH